MNDITRMLFVAHIISIIIYRMKKACLRIAGGCFTNILQALQNNVAKIYNARNHIYGENFKLKLCTCVQSLQIFSFKFSSEIWFLQNTNFKTISWRARTLLLKHPPPVSQGPVSQSFVKFLISSYINFILSPWYLFISLTDKYKALQLESNQ